MSVPPASQLAIKTDYRPIEHYGLIGDMRTVALVSKGGAIDWCCLPRFDGPSVFGRLLDAENGGHFQIKLRADTMTTKQFYWPETNVLVSRFLSPRGVVEVQDFMPVGAERAEGAPELVRRVRVSRGASALRLVCRPAFDYARADHDTHLDACGAVFESSALSLDLLCAVPLERSEDGGVTAAFELSQGETATFVLRRHRAGAERECLSEEQSQAFFEQTIAFWRRWLSQCQYTGRWHEMVQRSALTLKLLTFEPTGAIVAAPTTSLPNRIGGGRNWDFRATWIRDAAFTLYAFMRLGFNTEAAAFMGWLDQRYHESLEDRRHRDVGPLQTMYRIGGGTDLEEQVLDHLHGYRGSRPVRIGNRAHAGLQLDIYGELMDSVYLYNKYGAPISYDAWAQLRALVDWLCENWRRPDRSIWEVRDEPRQFVYSKVMCWVALDRALRLAAKRSLPAEVSRWRRVRDEIYEDILHQGWNEQRQAMTQAYGSECLDSSLLIMPLVFFMAPTDPRMLRTIDAMMQPAGQGGLFSDGLVYRWQEGSSCADGVEGPEGTFNMCSFWLVEALTRAGKVDPRRLDTARLLFEKMLGYGNHLGLYAEQTGDRGEALGNFPQGFTHLGLISAAYNLDRHLGGGG